MNVEKMDLIFDDATRIKKVSNKYQAAIYIVGCYGLIEEWKMLRKLYNETLTFGSAYEFHHYYSRACNKIERLHGFSAWYRTISL